MRGIARCKGHHFPAFCWPLEIFEVRLCKRLLTGSFRTGMEWLLGLPVVIGAFPPLRRLPTAVA